MNTSTPSSKSGWFSSTRNGQPSKATPVASASSEVNVDAQLPYNANSEGRVQSRHILSRHLSQSKLGVDTGVDRLSPAGLSRPRSDSSVSIDSAISNTSSVYPTHGTIRRAPKPLNTPTGSPSVPRRRSSGLVPSPDPPHWYRTSRKSSLASPALSTIEGSVPDLRAQDGCIGRVPDTNAGDASDVSTADSVAVKRDRTGPSLENAKQPKRQATEGDRQESIGSGTPSSITLSLVGEMQQESASNIEGASIVAEKSGVPPTLQNSDQTSITALRNWRSYLTLPKLSNPSDPSGYIPAPNASLPRNLSSESHPPQSSASGFSTDQASVSNAEGETIMANPGSTVSEFERRCPDVDKTSNPGQEGGSLSEVHPAADNANDKAGQENATASAPGPNKSVVSDYASIRIPPGSNATQRTVAHDHVRPASWWGWPLATSSTALAASEDLQSQEPQTTGVITDVAQSSRQLPMTSNADPASSAHIGENYGHDVSSTEANLGNIAKAEEVATTTWSGWLGSYLTAPVETTVVTYAAGIAPSITSSVGSSMVPDADETSPHPPDYVVDSAEDTPRAPPPTLKRINPLLEAMPRSIWSNLFASRILPYQKAIDNKPADLDAGEVETMHIDFRSPPPAETFGQSVRMVGSGSQESHSTLKQSNSGSLRGGDSSVDTPIDLIIDGAPRGQIFHNSDSNVSAVKPLTKDKKARSGLDTGSSKGKSPPSKPAKPNLVLPTFEDTFERPPRSLPLPQPSAATPASLRKAVTASLAYLFSSGTSHPSPALPRDSHTILNGKEREVVGNLHERLPKLHSVAGTTSINIHQNGRIAVIGIHGWFIQTYLKNVVGERTGTSAKFANMMKAAVRAYYAETGCALNEEAVTSIPLEGDGTVNDRTELLYENLMARQDWIEALNNADRIFVASHSQGTIVSTMLIERLINEGEINGTKCMMLNMCSVSQGPFYSLYNSWTVPAYLYFETAAATELFEFQKPQSAVSQAYIGSLHHILNAGVKILFVASLNDQVVPLYSALFSSLSHPNILRTIFIDSSVFETSADFMTNLVVFSTRLRNAGLNCHGLDFHLSEALMGSLVGVGHSAVYEEAMVYKYAVRYLMETTSPLLHGTHSPAQSDDVFKLEDFNPRAPANPYYLPWALRGIVEDPQIRALFLEELQILRDQFEVWQPRTKALQQVQAALEPLRLIPRSANSESQFEDAISKTDKKATAKL